MKKLLFVFGTRPEAIKMAPVILEAKKYSELSVRVVVTAQHRQMLDQVLRIFEIKPDYDLNLMSAGQTLNEISAKVLSSFHQILVEEKPDWVLVHGDTTTTMAASLAAFHCQIPVAHIEAGLRTYDLRAPFPEEMNRRVVGLVGSVHFAPTERALKNLEREGKGSSDILVVGNTVVDALQWVLRKFKNEPGLVEEIDENFPFLKNNHYKILVTMHRRENFQTGLASICDAIIEIVQSKPQTDVILPVHMNPIVQKIVHDKLSGFPQIKLIEPQGYLPFIRLMQLSDLILTDSGGLQEEAPTLGKPCLVLRETTERPEAIASGWARLVGTDKNKIVSNTFNIMNDQLDFESRISQESPFGDGSASKKMIHYFLGQSQ